MPSWEDTKASASVLAGRQSHDLKRALGFVSARSQVGFEALFVADAALLMRTPSARRARVSRMSFTGVRLR